jgi:hypothetical protein
MQLKVECAPVTWNDLILADSSKQENTEMKITFNLFSLIPFIVMIQFMVTVRPNK